MKAALGLLVAYTIYLAALLVSRLMVGNYLVALGATLFLVVSVILLVFCWAERARGYAASALAGIVFVAVSALAVLPGTTMNTEDAIWLLVISQVLPILLALESFKAYSEMKSIAGRKP